MEEKLLKGDGCWEIFCNKIDAVLKETLDKDIIIFGSNPGGEFIRWFYENFYHKQVTAVIDRWKLDNHYQVLHLMALYYMWSDKAVIINTLPDNLGPKNEFGNIGEVWERTAWKDEQIISLYEEIFPDCRLDEGRYITFNDWMEEEYSLDILKLVHRAKLKGEDSFGYTPADIRMILEAADIFDKNEAVIDLGSGKGGGMLAFRNCGFKTVAGIEYTDDIYNIKCDNLEKLGYCIEACTDRTIHEEGLGKDKVYCYLGDAAALREELDNYNNICLFNPFSYELTQKVFGNILESLKRKPRRLIIFYAEPMCHDVIMKSGKFALVKKVGKSLGGSTHGAYVYETLSSVRG